MTRARLVLQAIDQAIDAFDRHPTLVAAHARRGNTCQQLLRSLERYKTAKPTPTSRPFHDQVEPVDAQTAERFAREAESEHLGRRLRMNKRELDRRRKLKGLDLALEVIREAAPVSTVTAGNVEPSRSHAGSGAPPAQDELRSDPRWVIAEAQLHRAAMVLRDLIDEAKGYSRAGAVASLDASEKDKAIDEEGVGLTAEQVFFKLGPEYGSISYIRRYRREHKLDSRGNPRQDDAA